MTQSRLPNWRALRSASCCHCSFMFGSFMPSFQRPCRVRTSRQDEIIVKIARIAPCCRTDRLAHKYRDRHISNRFSKIATPKVNELVYLERSTILRVDVGSTEFYDVARSERRSHHRLIASRQFRGERWPDCVLACSSECSLQAYLYRDVRHHLGVEARRLTGQRCPAPGPSRCPIRRCIDARR